MDRYAKTGRYPKAIVPVALYGMPYRIDRIMAVADKYGIPVVENAAEGFGSRFDGQVLGTLSPSGFSSSPLGIASKHALLSLAASVWQVRRAVVQRK